MVFSVKDLLYEKSSLVFLGVSYCSFTLRTYDLKFLLGDNFFDIFFYDTFFRIVQFSRYKRSSGRINS